MDDNNTLKDFIVPNRRKTSGKREEVNAKSIRSN
jgi:hypothetical protein